MTFLVATLPDSRDVRKAQPEWLVAAQRGDRAACRRVVMDHERQVFGLLGKLLGARGADRVEDLAQETFLRVFRELPRFDPGGSAKVSSWILTIATRLAIDELRRPRIVSGGEPDALSGMDSPDSALHQRETRVVLERALERLTPEHRAVLLLREVHELDYDAIASAVGCEVGTVRSRLARAREAMRAAIATEGGN